MNKIINDYKNLGYSKLNSFFSIKYINSINNIIDNFKLKPSADVFEENDSGKIKQIQYLYKYHYKFNFIIEKLSEITKLLFDNNDFYILNMQLFEKHPQISKETRYHQDNAYFKLDPPEAVTFWISLDDINKENGSLYYIPKSHLEPTILHTRYSKNTTFRVRSGVPGLSLCIKNLDKNILNNEIIMNTKKGDVLIHHSNLIHRAGKNISINRRRRAIGLIFIPKKWKIDSEINKYYKKLLKEDIMLQKNPELYKKYLHP